YGSSRVGGAGSTASGLAMLMDATAKGIRKAIGHIDKGVIQPVVMAVWMDLMQTDDDLQAKGDCQVVARGSMAILVKEQSQARRQEFLARTANPLDYEIMGRKGRAALLREAARSLDIPVDDIVPSEEEMDNMQPAPNPEMAKLQAEAQQAQADRQAEAQEAAMKVAQDRREADQEHVMDRARLRLDALRYLDDKEERRFGLLMTRQKPNTNVDQGNVAQPAP
ncbi:MAG: hypothetical protein L0H83_03505, partial [Salinisphaera sp.]|nr:hypothetical protein [Salinisphaera sp.]